MGAKTEEKEKWFSCDLCEGKFRIEGALENHIKLKHQTVEIIDKEKTLKRNHSMSPKAERKRTKSDASHLKTQVNEKEEDLKLVKEELKHVKEQQSKKDKTKKESYDELKKEKDKIMEDMAKVLEEKDVKKGETREAVITLAEEEDEVEDALMDI